MLNQTSLDPLSIAKDLNRSDISRTYIPKYEFLEICIYAISMIESLFLRTYVIWSWNLSISCVFFWQDETDWNLSCASE